MNQDINPIEHGLLQDLLALYRCDLESAQHQIVDIHATRLNNAKRAFIIAIERYCKTAQMSDYDDKGVHNAAF